jgi:uncharacterized damage-inducible protein DinB
VDHYRLMARFNRWVNAELYGTVATLSQAAYVAERGAFFGSIARTLNHQLVVDRLWFNRFFDAVPEDFTGLDQVLHDDFDDLHAARVAADRWIVEVVDGLAADDLERAYEFTSPSTGQRSSMRGWHMLTTVFNHQTHHRGQVHAMMTRLAGEAPPLDLVYYSRETGDGL